MLNRGANRRSGIEVATILGENQGWFSETGLEAM
jgi:hypothetical protein